jgi:hypothetical protein
MLTTSRDLLVGQAVSVHAALWALGWGSLTLAFGILAACRREWRAAE